MKITRNTMRADGQTVGQAMDADAAFLRSIGIPAKDGQPTFDEKVDAIDEEIEAFKDKVRDTVLNALDTLSKTGKGWVDSDLTILFDAVDKHAKKMFFRERGVEVDDYYTLIVFGQKTKSCV